jgi:hypothetical protein
MKLLTKDIEKRLQAQPLYSQEQKGDDARVIAKFFNPCGRGTWYVLEGEKQDNGDWLFFGIAEVYEREYTYFTLSELEGVRLPFGLTIERDKYFKPCKVKDLN